MCSGNNMTVYLAKYMPVDEDEPVYASRIGATRRDAIEGIKEAAEEFVPTVSRLEWPDDADDVTFGNWIFIVREKELITEHNK